MRTIGIRELSSDVIEELIESSDLLGVTNGRALAGVLVPVDQQTLHWMTNRDYADIRASVEEAEAEMAAGERLTTLDELIDEPYESAKRRRFSRVSIRHLSGTRIVQAGQVGEVLVVTSDRRAVALLIPVTEIWVQRLVERSIAMFLKGQEFNLDDDDLAAEPPLAPALASMPSAAATRAPVVAPERQVVAAAAPVIEPARSGTGPGWTETLSRRHPWVPAGREYLQQRAIGIKILREPIDGQERLVGVITNMLARVVSDPVECALDGLDQNHVFSRILTLADDLHDQLGPGENLVGVGLEIGGHVNDGRVVYSPSTNWDRFPLADRLMDSMHLPVVLENDANALATYERWFHGIDDDRFVVVLLTNLGVGSGFVLDGRLYRGAHGLAGELGHVPVDIGGAHLPKCRCENTNCLERAATPHAIELDLGDRGFSGGIEEALRTPDAKQVQQAFRAAGKAMGRAAATLLNLLNPSAAIFHMPPQLVGRTREFRIESTLDLGGVSRLYVSAMLDAIRRNSFSSAAQDCRFILRPSTPEDGAAAAAACLIQHVLGRN